MSNKVKYIYVNPAQRQVLELGARETYVVAGRRFGKSSILGPHAMAIADSMPRGSGLWIGNSVKQLFTRTVPASLSILSKYYAIHEGERIFWGRPPEKFNIPKPYTIPHDWSRTISTDKGFVYHLISLEVIGPANSMTVNAHIGDETRFWNKAKYDEHVLPTLSGEITGLVNKAFSHENPFFMSKIFVSDASISRKANWMDEMEKMATPHIIEKLKQCYADASVMPELKRHPPFIRKVNKLRSECIAFFRFSTLENIDLLTEKYIADMKRTLPEIIFRVSILNEYLDKSKDGFYSNFDVDIHGYFPLECPAFEKSFKLKQAIEHVGGRRYTTDFESPDFNELEKKNDCTLDGDVKSGIPLHIAFDYGANSNFVSTAQVYNFEGEDSIMVLSSKYTLNERKLRELCRDWCAYYAPHKTTCREVFYYYDHTAKQGAYAVEAAQHFYEIVVEELEKKGWDVNAIYIGRAMAHKDKHQLINDLLSGYRKPTIRINREMENNMCLLIALENAEVSVRMGEIHKNKSLEKRKHTEENDPRTRTDVTDSFDTLVIGIVNSNFTVFSGFLPRSSR